MSDRMLETNKLVVASHNQGKVREFRELLSPFKLEVCSASELGIPEPEETGTTFEENAELKAVAAAEFSDLPALADDSGFCVDALNGDPGIYSARWAGPDRDFQMAMRNIEEKLQSAGALTDDKRKACFVAVISIAWPDKHRRTFRGEISGKAVWPPRGEKGFGYDPMFIPEGYNQTFGEMESQMKHSWSPDSPKTALSHRSRAFEKFARNCLIRP